MLLLGEKASASENSVTVKTFPKKKWFQIHKHNWSNTRLSILKSTPIFPPSFSIEFGLKMEILILWKYRYIPKIYFPDGIEHYLLISFHF